MVYISIITTIVLSLVAVGFLLGFLRGWKKSLIRGCMILGSLIASIFLAPAISSWLLDKLVVGTSFVGFGLSVDMENIVGELVGDGAFVTDLFSATETTTDLTIALINVLMNVIAFLVIFVLLYLITLIIYWIVAIVMRVNDKKKADNLEEGEETKPETEEKGASYWWLKVLGGGIGILSSLMVCFVLLTPVFGVMNVCDKFLSTSEKQTASAVDTSSLVCGELYYTENETIGQVEGYIQKYAEIRGVYNKSFIGGFLNYTGINFVGKSTFNYLTNVNANGLKVNITNELVSLVSAYNIYKENFVENEFDLANNESLESVLDIYDIANESEIVQSYIEEFIPKFCERWIAGEKFLGIAMPIKGEFEPVAKEVLKVFNTTNTTRIQSNVEAIVGVIQVANNNDVIKDVREGQDLIDILTASDVLVKEAELQLASTPELKRAMPKIMQEFIEIAYAEIVGGNESFEQEELTNQEIDSINWKTEAESMQGLTSSLLSVFNAIDGNADVSVMAGELSNVGKAIDHARNSVILNKPFQKFIEGFVRSEQVKLSEDVKASLLKPIAAKNADGTENTDCKWFDETYSFETTFSAIGEAAKVAYSIVSGVGDLNLETLAGVLKDTLANDDFKSTINEIIESNAIQNMLGDNAAANVLTDMVDTVVNSANTEADIENAIAAGQEIVNIVNDATNGGKLTLAGETEEEKIVEANAIVEKIASSDIVLELINTSSSTQGVAKDLGGDAEILKQAINTNTNISAGDRLILQMLFA